MEFLNVQYSMVFAVVSKNEVANINCCYIFQAIQAGYVMAFWKALVPAAVPVDAVFVFVVQRKPVGFPMWNGNVEDRYPVL